MNFSRFINLSDLNGSNGFTINGINSNDNSGFSVSSGGDINGDGIDDLIIGAFLADPNGKTDAGESYVVFGSSGGFTSTLELSNLNGSNGFTINGINEYDNSGTSVSSGGDINGDGIDDLIISAFLADPNGKTDAGESYVVFGSSGGFTSSVELSNLNGSNGFILNGIDSGDRFGYSVSSAGDVNGDGIDDLIIGTFGADPNGKTDAGESYVVFGSNGGFTSTLELSNLNGSNGFTLNGINEYDNSGLSVSSGGDINGDGIDDMIIGALFADPNGKASAGESYVVFGSNSFTSTLELSNLDGSNGFILNGINSNDFSGRSVSGAGDINGDGIDDLIIGALLADPNGKTSAGESYIVFGSSDGFTPTLELSNLNGSNGFTINGINRYDFSGRSVSSAGDVNGDGIDDIIIGADRADPNGNARAGESYVVFGSSDGFTPTLELSNLNGSNGFVINGIDRLDYSGYSVSSAGDVNGDGVDDIIIGAFRADPNSNDGAGESYVVFGNAAPSITTTTPVTTPENQTFVVDIDATDNSDSEANGLTYSISGGDDATLFSINENTGELSFDSAPDFENPTNNNGDNDYLLQISVTDSAGLIDTKDFTISVSDVAEFNVINGTAGNDILNGGRENDLINGEDGDDTLNGGRGNDTLNGGRGNDFLNGGGGSDRLNGDEGNDTLSGDAGNDTLNGGVGDDILDGGNGADTLAGDEGNDLISGGDANDILDGGAGADTLNGGAGSDTLNGSDGADLLFGDGSKDILNGGIGNDTLYGNNGRDTLSGNSGDDLIFAERGRDVLEGGEGNDTLDGGSLDDVIDGGEGEDVLISGRGADTVSGGTEADVFRYNIPEDGRDTITDFAVSEDIIDLSNIITGESFSSATPFEDYVTLVQQSSNTNVVIDQNGDESGGTGRLIASLENVMATEVSSDNFIFGV